MNQQKLWLVSIFIFITLTACSQSPVATPITAAPESTSVTTTVELEATPSPSSQPVAITEPTSEPTSTVIPTSTRGYQGFRLDNAGFATPESVLYDEQADVYLVANINGSPTAEDSNGFISRVSPLGDVIELKWIEGEINSLELNAPKGMALTSRGLYVTDIDRVHLFDRVTGELIQTFPVTGASFLNDVTSDDTESVYVSDSRGGSIFMLKSDGTIQTVIPTGGMMNPNGLAVWEGNLYVASGTGIFSIQDGSATQEFTLPEGSLDGLVFLDADNVLVSSWAASAIYHVSRDGTAIEVLSELESPADIGLDTVRGLILVPLFNDNAIEVHLLP